jgi:hypothetical protein
LIVVFLSATSALPHVQQPAAANGAEIVPDVSKFPAFGPASGKIETDNKDEFNAMRFNNFFNFERREGLSVRPVPFRAVPATADFQNALELMKSVPHFESNFESTVPNFEFPNVASVDEATGERRSEYQDEQFLAGFDKNTLRASKSMEWGQQLLKETPHSNGETAPFGVQNAALPTFQDLDTRRIKQQDGQFPASFNTLRFEGIQAAQLAEPTTTDVLGKASSSFGDSPGSSAVEAPAAPFDFQNAALPTFQDLDTRRIKQQDGPAGFNTLPSEEIQAAQLAEPTTIDMLGKASSSFGDSPGSSAMEEATQPASSFFGREFEAKFPDTNNQFGGGD